jgi:hypothetical protein
MCRYALTLRIMLANLRRKIGLTAAAAPAAMPQVMPLPASAEGMVVPATLVEPGVPQPFTLEELGFAWPSERGIFSPSAIPLWLQEQVCTSIVSLKM